MRNRNQSDDRIDPSSHIKRTRRLVRPLAPRAQAKQKEAEKRTYTGAQIPTSSMDAGVLRRKESALQLQYAEKLKAAIAEAEEKMERAKLEQLDRAKWEMDEKLKRTQRRAHTKQTV